MIQFNLFLQNVITIFQAMKIPPGSLRVKRKTRENRMAARLFLFYGSPYFGRASSEFISRHLGLGKHWRLGASAKPLPTPNSAPFLALFHSPQLSTFCESKMAAKNSKEINNRKPTHRLHCRLVLWRYYEPEFSMSEYQERVI